MAKRGPKPKEIDWDQFNKLCHLQCTLREISAWFNCSEDTIENRCKAVHGVKFSEYYAQKSSTGKIAIRRLQMQSAEKGSTAMLIWLGKQYLEQSDKVESDNTTNNITTYKIGWADGDTESDPSAKDASPEKNSGK